MGNEPCDDVHSRHLTRVMSMKPTMPEPESQHKTHHAYRYAYRIWSHRHHRLVVGPRAGLAIYRRRCRAGHLHAGGGGPLRSCRAELRTTCTALGGPGLGEWVVNPEELPGRCSMIRVRTECTGPRGIRQRVVHYYISYISSRTADTPPGFVLGHWGVENGLHRSLDMPKTTAACTRHIRCRDGHPPAGYLEHGTHASAELRSGCVHRAVARQDRPSALDPALRPALSATLCLP